MHTPVDKASGELSFNRFQAQYARSRRRSCTGMYGMVVVIGPGRTKRYGECAPEWLRPVLDASVAFGFKSAIWREAAIGGIKREYSARKASKVIRGRVFW
jgi:hypothetical protein